jgi:hypothetical protein
MSELFMQFRPKLTDEIKAKIKAQEEYQNKKELPNFAPSDGVCWSCHNQIYNHISLEYASTRLITGCPVCHRSYCD